MLYIYFENITFNEIAVGLLESFNMMNIQSRVVNKIDSNNVMDLYIILGMNDFISNIIPNNYIVYQFEQTTDKETSKWFGETYLRYLKNALEVWDYSLVNYQNLQKMGIDKVKYVPLQYAKSIESITQLPPIEKSIDVLFYGSMNDRRTKIISGLLGKGLNVVVKSNLWQEERKELISKSKIIVNIHYYDHNILETSRISYLLSNNCMVVSETGDDPVLDKWHNQYIKLVPYDNLVTECDQIIRNYQQYYEDMLPNIKKYKNTLFCDRIPRKVFDTYGCFITPINNKIEEIPPTPMPPVVDSRDLFEAEQEITKDKELVLKLPPFNNHELPNVSIVTVTYNRKNIFPMAIRNWQLFDYPRDKLEWVIVDDSDDGSTLSSILPKSQQIKYFRLQTTGRLSIGQKRNFGVEKSIYDYIIFMDDDDYYYPCSIYARIALLLKYPSYDLVGVTDLDIYDIVNDFSARVNGSLISEASMGFKKSFWNECHFPDKFNTLGEGYPFTKDRRNRIIKMPSCFNIIAMTHWSNYTQNNRSQDKFKHVTKKDNILSTLDFSSQLFIVNLFKKCRGKQGSP